MHYRNERPVATGFRIARKASLTVIQLLLFIGYLGAIGFAMLVIFSFMS